MSYYYFDNLAGVRGLAAVGVALIGGVIEAKKTLVQNNLLAMMERLRRSWVKPS